MLPVTGGTPIGRIRLDEVFAYYDGPRLFLASNETGQRFLAVHADTTDDSEVWLYAPLSEERTRHIREGHIDLHDAFKRAESNGVWRVAGLDASPECSWVTTDDLDAEILPDVGERLTLAELRPAPQIAVATSADRLKCDVLEAHLEAHGAGRNAAPVRLVGAFLEALQEMTDAIGQLVYDVYTERGRISEAVLAKTQLFALATPPGSFGVTIVAGRSGTFIGETDTAPVIAQLNHLLEVKSDPDRLRERLMSMRSRTAAKYRRMLESLVSADATLRLYWGSPRRPPTAVTLSLVESKEALMIVNSVEREMAEVRNVRGILKAIDVTPTRKFKLLEVAGRELAGYVLDQAMPTAEHATVNEEYLATVRVVREVSSSGAKRERYYLEALARPVARP